MEAGIFSSLRSIPKPDRGTSVLSTGPAEVRAYWEALRENGRIPARTALDPRGISAALDRVFLAERIGPGLAQVRLSGNRVNDLVGMDTRGLPISCLFGPEARAELARLIAAVFDGPVVADLQLTAPQALGRPHLEARAILLPLLDARGACSLLLGCIALQGEVGRAPRRFEITRAVEERLTVEPRQPRRPLVSQTTHAADDRPDYLKLVYSAG